jgi:hypothetical protein
MNIQQALQNEIEDSKRWLDRELMKVLTNGIFKNGSN